MIWVHAHLILNHVPAIGTLACLILLGFGIGLNKGDLLRAGLWGLVGVAGVSVVVYLTGLQAASTVNTLASVDPRAIPPHENLAYYALIWSLVTGGFSAVGLWRFGSGSLPGWYVRVLLGAAVLKLVLMGWSGYLGANVTHPEVRGSGGEQPSRTSAGRVVGSTIPRSAPNTVPVKTGPVRAEHRDPPPNHPGPSRFSGRSNPLFYRSRT